MKKVLVLEDEASIRSFIVINLQRAGYEVVEAECGEEALQKRGTGLAAAIHTLNHMRIDTRRTPSTTLIRQHHTEMLDGLLNPTIGTWTERTGAGTTGTTLQEHEQRKIIMHMFGSGDHTVEQAD